MLYGVDDKVPTTSTDVSLIIPNLYLGSIEAAQNTDYLKQLGITHILTLEDRPLNAKFIKDFKYKYICIYDLPLFNIFTVFDDCFKFIDEGTTSPCAILIHCLLGVSRSATLVLAYLMFKQKRNLNELYEFVKQKRYIRPNNGFIKQLEIFEAMNFVIDKESSVYKSYMLDKLAENVKKGANISDIYSIELNGGENNINKNSSSNNNSLINSTNTTITHYKCKKCRFYLFNINNRIKHLKSYERFDSNDWDSKLNYYKKLNYNSLNNNNGGMHSECSKEIFIEPVSWLIDKISSLEGKINCPKCDTKIGSFNWCGHKCACATWVVPAFHIYDQKVDICNPLPTLPNRQQLLANNNNTKLLPLADDDDNTTASAQQQQKVENMDNIQQQQQQHQQEQLVDNSAKNSVV